MSRKLYGWEKDGKIYLSAFAHDKTLNGRRPATEFSTKEGMEAEIARRGAELVWENGNP